MQYIANFPKCVFSLFVDKNDFKLAGILSYHSGLLIVSTGDIRGFFGLPFVPHVERFLVLMLQEENYTN